MSGETIIVTDDETSSVASSDAVEDMAEAVEDAVMDSTTIQLVERVTRTEDALQVLAANMEALTQRLEDTVWKAEMAQSSADVANERITEVAEEAADAIEETVEDVVEATDEDSEKGSEITEDEVPTTREHPFFRKWGRGK